MADFREAELSPSLRALGDYALKLTLSPAKMGREDVTVLRSHGFTDEQILAANLVASYFNFINRVADGLGVDLEDWMTDND
jgi:uncharacterized peroxidase-related enzyme